MSPVSLQNGEVQYYASPVLVKNVRYHATITNLRLIIEGSVSREFRVANIVAAYPAVLEENKPGIKLVLATPTGQKEMLLSFPLGDVFKKGEQEAWLNAIQKAVGDKPFAEGALAPATEVETSPGVAITPQKNQAQQETSVAPNLIRGESVLISTAGIRIKHSFYTAYLTNLRFILQNNMGKIGREFAIAELKDAAELESDSGEAEIAMSVGMQSGLKQMILTFPTRNARDAWMRELHNKLPRKQPELSHDSVSTTRIGTFVPATNERVLISTPNVKIKNRPMVLHLTNTRFIIDSSSGVMGEFAVNSLIRAVRISSELGEPGINVTIGSPSGKKDMHLIFMAMNDREAWMDELSAMIPKDAASPASFSYGGYSVTSVEPKKSSQTLSCPKCGALNNTFDEFCALCGANLHEPSRRSPLRREREIRARKEPRMRQDYTGGIIGFITRPTDAYEYYSHESPKTALPMCLIVGLLWAILTSLLLAYVFPFFLNIEGDTFPVLVEIQTNFMALLILILILYVIWFISIIFRAVVAGLISHIFDPTVKLSEVMAIVMRSSFAYGVCGWIPVLGLFVAGIWSAISTWFGLRITQNLSAVASAIASVLGLIIVYVVIIVVGMI